MKSVVLTGIKQMDIIDVPAPKIQRPDDVLLKIEQVGVCGSDVHYYETGKIGSQVVQYPYKVGHECSATVSETGPDVKNLKPGDQVAIEPGIICHKCDQCLQGRENTCRNMKFLGCPGQIDGCMCEYMVMPAENCLKITDKISLEQGVICEPFAIGYYGAKQAQLKPGSTVAVLGAGPIGLSTMVAAINLGAAKVYMTEIIPERITTAAQNGAEQAFNPQKEDVVKKILELEPLGLDAVFECAGQQQTVDQGLEMLKMGGKLMLTGIPREDRFSFMMDYMRRKEITVINVRRQNKCTEACIDLIAENKVDVDFMVTHRFDISQSKDAFDLVADYKDGVVKAIINF